jgi:hypothetical protein
MDQVGTINFIDPSLHSSARPVGRKYRTTVSYRFESHPSSNEPMYELVVMSPPCQAAPCGSLVAVV